MLRQIIVDIARYALGKDVSLVQQTAFGFHDHALHSCVCRYHLDHSHLKSCNVIGQQQGSENS